MIIKNIKNGIILLFALFLFSCATTENDEKKEPDILDVYGSFANNKYINEYYGFELEIPENYIVQDDEAKDHVLDLGNKILNGGDEDAMEQLKLLTEEQLFNLLFITKYEVGTPGVENIIMQIFSENLMFQPGIKDGSDYLWHFEKQLENAGIVLTNKSEFLLESINGIDFNTFSYDMLIQNTTVKQKMFTKKVGGHILCFGVTYFTDEGLNELTKLLNTISPLSNSMMTN